MQAQAYQPTYDPARTYDDNFDNGPFGVFFEPKPYQNTESPSHTFLGYPVYLPFGIAAGPLLNAKYVASALAMGFDVVCYKTQRSRPFTSNSFPNVVFANVEGDLTLEKSAGQVVVANEPGSDPSKLTITNSFGMPSRGPEFWVPDLAKALTFERPGQFVYASVVGTARPGMSEDEYFNDFAATAKLAAATGVKAIEVNLSCPNVASEGILCYTPAAVDDICRRTKEAIGDIPLMIKIGYYSPQQDKLLRTIMISAAPYVAAVSAINTIPAEVVNEKGTQALPGKGRLKSGLCGAGIKWAGLEMTSRLNRIRSQLGLGYEIVGVGGVMMPADYFEYREAGADVVQSCTGSMWNPHLAIDIKMEKQKPHRAKVSKLTD
jgi:dihydroorotate dehydrogenase (NAD+) catalytic subunit